MPIHSPFFNYNEFIKSKTADKLGIDNTPTKEAEKNLIHTMDCMITVRLVLGRPCFVTSGYRCEALNKAVGGSKNSQHMKGEACDFICPEFGTPKQVCEELEKYKIRIGFDQLIYEGTWVHISFTSQPRGEILTKKNGKYLTGIVS